MKGQASIYEFVGRVQFSSQQVWPGLWNTLKIPVISNVQVSSSFLPLSWWRHKELEYLQHSPKKALERPFYMFEQLYAPSKRNGYGIRSTNIPDCALSSLGELKGKQSGAINGQSALKLLMSNSNKIADASEPRKAVLEKEITCFSQSE